MRFIADENIPLKVIEKLKKEGIDIKSVAEISIGLKDEEIINISKKENAIVITFDKDFGEIIFRKSIKPHGIILLRIRPKSVEYIFKFLRWILIESKIKFDKKFIVIKEDKIREIHI